MLKPLCLSAAEDVLQRRYPESSSDEQRKALLSLAGVRLASVLKESIKFRQQGDETGADSLIIEYKKLRTQAEQFAKSLGVEFVHPIGFLKENLAAQVEDLKTIDISGKGGVLDQMARALTLAMVRGAVADCLQAGVSEVEILEVLGPYQEEGFSTEAVTARISGRL